MCRLRIAQVHKLYYNDQMATENRRCFQNGLQIMTLSMRIKLGAEISVGYCSTSCTSEGSTAKYCLEYLHSIVKTSILIMSTKT